MPLLIYGTIDNWIACSDLGIKAHFPELKDDVKDLYVFFERV